MGALALSLVLLPMSLQGCHVNELPGSHGLQGAWMITRRVTPEGFTAHLSDSGLNHSVDYMSENGIASLNKVNTMTLHDEAWLQYGRRQLNVRLSGDFRWRHVSGRMHYFDVHNIFDFQYGLSARYTLPHLNTTVAAKGTMCSRQGYGSSELDTDDFVVNASIGQPLFKGRLIARIEAFDLLHQLSSTLCEVNAQGRTGTWRRSLPHYVMLHLACHWNKNPKRK